MGIDNSRTRFVVRWGGMGESGWYSEEDLTAKREERDALLDPSPRTTVRRTFSKPQAKRIGDRLGVDWRKISLAEFRTGLVVELEHGRAHRKTNVTNDDAVRTGKIALAHLNEDPHYYARLRRAGVKDVPAVRDRARARRRARR